MIYTPVILSNLTSKVIKRSRSEKSKKNYINNKKDGQGKLIVFVSTAYNLYDALWIASIQAF